MAIGRQNDAGVVLSVVSKVLGTGHRLRQTKTACQRHDHASTAEMSRRRTQARATLDSATRWGCDSGMGLGSGVRLVSSASWRATCRPLQPGPATHTLAPPPIAWPCRPLQPGPATHTLALPPIAWPRRPVQPGPATHTLAPPPIAWPRSPPQFAWPRCKPTASLPQGPQQCVAP